MTIKVVHQGLGPIGQGNAKLVLEDPNLEIVGAIDIQPRYSGDLGEILGKEKIGVKVTIDDDAGPLLRKLKPDVLVLATSSNIDEIKSRLDTAIKNRVNVVSPAEQLFYPEFIDKKYALELNEKVRSANIRILGRGVNPGCLMDVYPLHIFQTNYQKYKKLDLMIVYRWDNIVSRRESLLKKIGVGLTEEDFIDLNKKGRIGHVGLCMSAAYLADHIGIKGYDLRFARKPLIAEQTLKPDNGDEIRAGRVAGLDEICNVVVDDKEIITLNLKMAVGIEKRNCVYINGEKTDYSNIVNGDIATYRILKDAITHVVSGPPGLNTIDYVPDPNKILKE